MEKKRMIPVIVAIFLIFIVAAIGIGMKLIEKYSYSKEEMDLNTYYGVEAEWQIPLILQNEIIEDKAVLREGFYYIPLSFVKKNLNSRFYYDSNEKKVLYTTPLDFYEISLDSMSYTINDQLQEYTSPIFIMQDEVAYLEIGFVAQYSNFISQIYENPNRIHLYINNETYQQATINKDTAVRYQGGVKSDILEKVLKGDNVVILEEMENWSKVKTSDSVIGYVENKRLKKGEDVSVTIPQNFQQPEYTSITRNHPINLVWHQVTNESANEGVDALLANTKGVNTISPTWYFLSDNAGNFTNLVNTDYINNMHSRGIEVWALIDNFTNDVDISQILGTTTNRKNLINQLVNSVSSYGIEGINIDFEQVPEKSGEDYVQFLRELSIACRKNNIVLSVDNYVPTEYTAHYDRKEQGCVVDYVIIMGYDEHYNGSSEAGSVASIGFVQQGIEKTISEVPANKVINAIPFYTRMWKLANGISSEALSMKAAEEYLAQHGVSATWDEVTCQNYASFEADGATYQIWLEDASSVAVKLNVMSQYGLAGIAEWKLGLEKPEIWDLIAGYLANAQTGTAVQPVIQPEILDESVPAETQDVQSEMQDQDLSEEEQDQNIQTEAQNQDVQEILTDGE